MLQCVRRFGCDGDEIALMWAGQEPVDKAFVGCGVATLKAVFAAAEALDFELVAGVDVVLAAQFCGEDEAALGGHDGFHRGISIAFGRGVVRGSLG